MKEDLGSCQSLGASPRLRGAEYFCKGWSSERIPHPAAVADGINRRKHFSPQATPFYGARALPSKWEDAERWICSPVLTNSNIPSRGHHPQFPRKPTSKSGPLFPPPSSSDSSFEFAAGAGVGVAFTRHLPDGGVSPFTSRVFVPYSLTNRLTSGEGESLKFPAFSELVNCASRDGDSRNFSRRDMATQMSSGSSVESTIEGGSPSPPSIMTIVQRKEESKVDIREVQVDKRATVIDSSTRYEASSADSQRDPASIDYCTWEISEAASDVSKLKREEAKITAWENLQKAKAEASIRKLEMKLEKKRASSMNKIIRKLKTAESKAKVMRTSMNEVEEIPVSAASLPLSCAQKNSRFCMLYSCFSSKPL